MSLRRPWTSHSQKSGRPVIGAPTNFRRVPDTENFDGTLKYTPLALSFDVSGGRLSPLPDFDRFSFASMGITRPKPAVLRESIVFSGSDLPTAECNAHTGSAAATDEGTPSPLLNPNAFNNMLPGLSTSEPQRHRFSLPVANKSATSVADIPIPRVPSESYLISLPQAPITPPPTGRSRGHSNKNMPEVPVRHPARLRKFSTTSSSSTFVNNSNSQASPSMSAPLTPLSLARESSNAIVDSEIAELNAFISARRQSALRRNGLSPAMTATTSAASSPHVGGAGGAGESRGAQEGPHHVPAIAPQMKVRVRSETLSDIGSALSVPLSGPGSPQFFFGTDAGTGNLATSVPGFPATVMVRESPRRSRGGGWRFPWSSGGGSSSSDSNSSAHHSHSGSVSSAYLRKSLEMVRLHRRSQSQSQNQSQHHPRPHPHPFYGVTMPAPSTYDEDSSSDSLSSYSETSTESVEDLPMTDRTVTPASGVLAPQARDSLCSFRTTDSGGLVPITGLRKRGMSMVKQQHVRGESVESVDSIGSSILDMEGAVPEMAVDFKISPLRGHPVGVAV